MKYRTKDKTAMEGKDFLGGDFSLLFRHGETEKRIVIPIIDDMSAKGKEEYFEVCLFVCLLWSNYPSFNFKRSRSII